MMANLFLNVRSFWGRHFQVDFLDDVMDAWLAVEERTPLSLCKAQLGKTPALFVVHRLVGGAGSASLVLREMW